MSWQQVIDDRLAGALPRDEFLDAVLRTLDAQGIRQDNTFAAVSICRDELTQTFLAAVARRWTPPFNLGGLGGLPSLGHTGWGACLSHVPNLQGRGHLLIFGLPHVGIGPDGEIGRSLRPYQDHLTPTCGALGAVLAGLEADAPIDEPSGLADAEARRLESLVTAELTVPPRDLIELSRAAARAVEREMWAELDMLAPWAEMDVSVFTGLQIHLPDGRTDYVLPLTAAVRHAADDRERAVRLLLTAPT